MACQDAIEVYDPKKKNKSKKIELVPDDYFSDYSGSEDSDDPEDPNYADESEVDCGDQKNSNSIEKVYFMI